MLTYVDIMDFQGSSFDPGAFVWEPLRLRLEIVLSSHICWLKKVIFEIDWFSRFSTKMHEKMLSHAKSELMLWSLSFFSKTSFPTAHI